MGWVDFVPRTGGGGLYIGGLHALFQRQDLFKAHKISHIVSVLDFDIYEAGHFKEYKHLHIRIDDDPNENLLAYFEQTTKFIDKALSEGGAVFVHCAMGKSRSAAIVCAYLMWKDGSTPSAALEQLREGRGVCEPNPGFMEQLETWYHMQHAKDRDEYKKTYEYWVKNRYTGDWYTRRWSPKL